MKGLFPCAFLAVLACVGCNERKIVVEVSPTGAVASPEAARDAVRAERARRAAAGDGDLPVEVVFADGVYRIDRPLELTAADSGTPEAPVVWRAANRGKAVFTGGTPLSWCPLSDENVRALLPEAARGNVLVADVPGAGPLPSFLNGSHFLSPSNDIPVAVYAGDERLDCARGPDVGFYETGASDLSRPGTGEVSQKGGSFAFDRGKLAVWVREPFAWTFGLWGVYWADLRAPLDHVDLAIGRICLDDPRYVPFGLREDMPFYVFNAFCELNRPGEWVVDRERRRIYLWPKDGRPVELVLTEGLVRLKGVSNLAMDGIAFEKSRRTAVRLTDCSDVTLRACAVRHTCSWGVEVSGGRRCRVAGCDLTDLGEGGIQLDGGDPKALVRADHVAENNHVSHYGRVFYNYRQGISVRGVGNSALHNLVHHSPHTGIFAMGNDLTIAWNVIHDTCEFNDDAGAIYVYNYSFVRRGVTVEHNLVHMTGRKRYPSNTEGIYLDDYSPENIVRNNIVNRANLGIHLAGGQCNETYGNVLLNCQKALILSTRANWPNSKLGRKSSNFRELDADIATYSSEKWLAHYPGLRRLLDFKGDDVLAHHAFWNVVSNNVAAYSGPFEHSMWDVISNTTVWSENVLLDKADPGLADFRALDWSARPGSPHASQIAACGFERMGLYDSDERLTPVVKFGSDVTRPTGWGAPLTPPVIRFDLCFEGEVPQGETAFARDLEQCEVPEWSQGRRVYRVAKCPTDAANAWREVRFSFVPTADATFAIHAMGGASKEVFTEYADVKVTGVGDAANPFPDANVQANDAVVVHSRPLTCRKGERVTVSFRARHGKIVR